MLRFLELRAKNTHRRTVALHRGSHKNRKVPHSVSSVVTFVDAENIGGMAFANTEH